MEIDSGKPRRRPNLLEEINGVYKETVQAVRDIRVMFVCHDIILSPMINDYLTGRTNVDYCFPPKLEPPRRRN